MTFRWYWSWWTNRAARRAALAWWLAEALVAFVAILPLAHGLRQIARPLPNGDAVWFEPGAVYLLELARLHGERIVSAIQDGLITLALLAALPAFATAWLLAVLGGASSPDETPSPLERSNPLLVALGATPRFLALWFLVRFLQGLLVLLAGLSGGIVAGVFDGHISERTSDLLVFGALLGGVGLAGLVQIAGDLVRVAWIVPGTRVLRAGRAALQTMRRKLGSILGLWLPLQVLRVSIWFAAGTIVGALRVETPGLWRAVGATLVHQLGFFLLCLIYVSWVNSSVALMQSVREDRKAPRSRLHD